jgi:hypothetical protein
MTQKIIRYRLVRLPIPPNRPVSHWAGFHLEAHDDARYLSPERFNTAASVSAACLTLAYSRISKRRLPQQTLDCQITDPALIDNRANIH